MTLRTLFALGALALAVAPACSTPSESQEPNERTPSATAQSDSGRITARPRSGGGKCRPGEHTFGLGAGRTARMRVTTGGVRGRKALIIALHGANSGGAGGGLYALRGGWKFPGIVMVAPEAAGPTWTFLRGRDEDLPFVNRALARAFARCRIDPRRIAVGGFSDGATYALTLGLQNGDLFRAVIALSPGGVLAEQTVGKPRVFIAHGTMDRVLPIARASDRIVRELRRGGYRVTYRKFPGGHQARPEISREAVRWFLRG